MFKRVLIAHAKGESVAQIALYVERLQTRFPSALVTSARAEWFNRIGSAGSVAQLLLDLGGGSTLRGEPAFDLIVCPRISVGNWTAEIVRAALIVRRRTIVAIEGDDFLPVTGIKCLDPEDYASGWELDVGPQAVFSDGGFQPSKPTLVATDEYAETDTPPDYDYSDDFPEPDYDYF